MKKVKKLLIIISILCLVVFVGMILFLVLKPKVAGIYIDATPAATVLVNGKEMGSTPFRMTQKPGEVVIKLIPKDISQTALFPYETRVALLPGVETVVRHTFGATEESGSGEIISFESIAKNETALAIVTIPDGAEITIDDKAPVFGPHKTSDISAGDHTILIKAKGYADRQVKVKTHEGYKLTAIVTLSKNPIGFVATPTPSPTPTQIQTGAVVQIAQIAGGTVRVRKEAKTGSEELGVAKSGETYPYLDRDTATGWFKIAFEGKEGWVSSQYAKKVEIKPSGSVTPIPTKAVTVKPSVVITPTPQVSPTLGG
jgi:hypothetical protein